MKRTKFFTVAVVLVVGLLAAAVFIAALPASAETPAGPEGADIVVASSVNPELVYAADLNTVYRSEDGGETWTELGVLPGIVTALAPANQTETLVYAGTRSSGAFRSFDGGQTWQTINVGLGMAPGALLEVSALAVDPINDALVYAATGFWLGTTEVRFSPMAIVASASGGSTWLPLAELPLGSQRIASLAPVAGQPLAVAAADATGAAVTYQANAEALAAIVAATDATIAQRSEAAHILGLLGDASDGETLIAALEAQDTQLVYRAAEALGRLKAADAVPALGEMLLAGDSLAPAAAADALAAIASPEAIDILLAALDSDTMTPARHVAMSALEQLGSAAVPGLLETVAEGSLPAQRSAAEMLGYIGDPAAVDGLVAALQSGDEMVRAETAWALGEIGSPAAYEALARVAAGDPSSQVRLHATQALARLPEAPAVAAVDTQPAVTSSTGTAVVVQEKGIQTPAWLSPILPALRWVVLVIALALVALLPWYQGVRENRRRHN